MPRPPKIESTARPDETPKTFAELKPPGCWNGKYFVPVRLISTEEFWERSILPDCIAALGRERKH